MPGKSPKTNEAKNGDCLADDLLYRHLEKTTTQEEEARIEQHLDTCNSCFAEVTALMEIIQTPITEAEKIEIVRSRKVSPEEQVQRILDWVETPPESHGRKKTKPEPGMIGQWLIVMGLVAIYRRHRRTVRYGAMFTASLAIIWGSWRGIGFYQTDYRIGQAMRLMEKNYLVSVPDQEPRLSGNYAPTAQGTLMGPAEKKRPYLVESFKLTKGAIAHGYKGTLGKQLLAQFYILNEEYAQADSLLQQLKHEPATLAAALNDQGVLHFNKKNWKAAAHLFTEAIAADSTTSGARYNLALAKIEMGETAGVAAILDDCIKLETVNGWKDAARKLKNNLP